jgi:hypothetical protein
LWHARYHSIARLMLIKILCLVGGPKLPENIVTYSPTWRRKKINFLEKYDEEKFGNFSEIFPRNFPWKNSLQSLPSCQKSSA